MFKNNYGFGIFILIIIFSMVSVNISNAQQNQKKKVRVSPKAGVLQTVGFTEVNISYSRPGVKGRTIWGKLVPYNVVWRAGADEATKFTFSTDVKINGKTLKAGSYSFFAIPTEDEWTLIFNKVADQWGAFEYNIAEDAMRFMVKPKKNDFQEWLAYTFSDMTTNSATINLNWEKLSVPFKIEVDVE
ncbi:MAG: DUF2911 domain-containing protein [Ignavibacteriaceae bacterium]